MDGAGSYTTNKTTFCIWPRAFLTSKPLLLKNAYNKTDIARVGFHNDCFLASQDDYGTFYDYGNFVSKRDTTNPSRRKYFEADSRYVPAGGETCIDAFSPQNDFAPVDHAENKWRLCITVTSMQTTITR